MNPKVKSQRRQNIRYRIRRKKMVGEAIAKKAVELGIKDVTFDRSGYLYHGRVKSVADGAREGGLKF